MVIHGLIAREAFRQGTKIFRRYYALEGKAFNKLYTGFPRSRTIGRGVRHGLTTGSILGSLISGDDNQLNDAVPPAQKKPRITSSKPYKTRFRFARRCRPEQRFNKTSYHKY